MFYAGHWSGYLVINRPLWNKGFRGSHDITLIIRSAERQGPVV